MKNAFYDGHYARLDQIRIPLSDRSIFFGDAVYDAAIGRGGGVFMMSEHIARFAENALALKIPMSYTSGELCDVIRTVIESSEISGDYFIYIQLSRAADKRQHACVSDKSKLLITVTPHRLRAPSDTLRLKTYPDIRYGMCNIKTVNLLPAVLASTDAVSCGLDEAVFVKDGIVTECAHSNIHILKDGKIYSHPNDNSVLPGISKEHLRLVARRAGVPFIEREFTKEELYLADEVIITSTSKLALRAEAVDGVRYFLEKSSLAAELCQRMRQDYDEFYNQNPIV